LTVEQTPSLGSILVWGKKLKDGTISHGHVAVVEKIETKNGKLTITTSESGYNSFAFKTRERTNDNGRWGTYSDEYYFRGFVKNPAVK